jgi:ABC-2 type transport system ATP-binding protein
MADAVIETDRLTKKYGTKAVVNRLDLTVPAGEVFGLLGPNGAGKTTTILMLLGLTEPSSGSARMLGLDPLRDPLAIKRRVGYLPDAVGFYDGMTGRENLRFTARLNRLDRGEVEPAIDRVLGEVGLSGAGDQLAGTYSRGMSQRLGIADALLKDPSVLILDEPTTAIDPEGVAEILRLIRRLADERGVAVLLSSHLLHQVQEVCDRVAIFVDGRVVVSGRPGELAARGAGPESVEVGVADETDLGEILMGAAGVRRVERGRTPRSWTVETDRGTTARLVATLVGRGVKVIGVHRTAEDLDRVYRSYFDKERSHV